MAEAETAKIDMAEARRARIIAGGQGGQEYSMAKFITAELIWRGPGWLTLI
jgi:hypothetical protein